MSRKTPARRRLDFEGLERRAVPTVLPPGFNESVIASGIGRPTAMEIAPDGRIFIAEQGGALRVVKNGALLATPFVSLNVNSAGERGLLGVTFDPNFATNQFVYVYYTTGTGTIRNRVSRFVANGDVAVSGSETPILDLEPLSSATNHNGGAIHFGPDGKLYVAVGENATPSNSQTLTNRLGKILRINSDGTIPADNPFFSTATGANRAIWSLGLRNPFAFAFQPGTSRMYINDVGQNTWEEINTGVAGANYGWPLFEGPSSDPSFAAPTFIYGHGTGLTVGCAITGGVFYNPTTVQYPAADVGKYFFADFCSGWIRKYDPVTNNAIGFVSELPFGPVDLKVDAAGSLYYLSRGAGANGGILGRIGYTAPVEVPPAIIVQPNNASASVGQTATFVVTATGTNLTYQWRRNGVDISGANQPVYRIDRVSANDDGATFQVLIFNTAGNVTSRAVGLTVTPNLPPAGNVTTPDDFFGGQLFTFSARGEDTEDGILPSSAFTYQVDLNVSGRLQPVVPLTRGSTGSFLVPKLLGESTDLSYRVTYRIVDSVGQGITIVKDVLPRIGRVTVASDPAGIPLALDGRGASTPFTFQAIVGTTRVLGALSTVELNGQSLQFVSWSDGGANIHSIDIPTGDSRFEATYRSFIPFVIPGPTSVTSAGRFVRSIVVGFSGDLDLASARSRANYRLVSAGRDGRLGTRDDRATRFRSVVYDAALRTVTLTPAGRVLANSSTVGARLIASRPTGIKDALGRLIDGNRDGQAGGDFLFPLRAVAPAGGRTKR